jgi:outer membrane protein assembly factor BamB
MTMADNNESSARKPLRLWPGVVLAGLLGLVWLALPIVVPGQGGTAILAGVAGGFLVLVWWLFFSRAPWSERVGAIVLMAIAVYGTYFFVHESIANGFMGRMLIVFSVPVTSLALVAWAASTRRLSTGPRRALLVVFILAACALFTIVRTGGITGEAASDLHWRWTPTPEDRLLALDRDAPAVLPSAPAVATPQTPDPAQAGDEAQPSKSAPSLSSAPAVAETPKKPVAAPASAEPLDPSASSGSSRARSRDDSARGRPAAHPARPAGAKTSAEWPGFRGPARDSVVHDGVRIETDWSRTPPAELWRKPIGPGWSSFAVRDDVFYTQEQRGDSEIVSAYNLTTGEPVWRHADPVRFYESNGGAGPRGTPTVSSRRVYTFGATGILNALDAENGAVVWSRNAAADTGEEVPGWGFSSSPLVVDDLVIVAASGRLAAYDAGTGQPRWLGPEGGGGYSSPHLVTIDGVPQILLLRGARSTSVAPVDGSLLWEHRWQPGVSIVQPALAANGDILIAAGDAMGGNGIKRLAAAHGPAGWTVEERWTSRGLKPYFNDFVVHGGHAFGFDGSILACIDLADGTRKWKGGRYGHGQMVLLPDQDMLLVLSEEGELALVRAAPDKFTEVARVPAIEGKTWNHPVLVGDILLVRNGEEMAAFRLALAGR